MSKVKENGCGNFTPFVSKTAFSIAAPQCVFRNRERCIDSRAKYTNNLRNIRTQAFVTSSCQTNVFVNSIKCPPTSTKLMYDSLYDEVLKQTQRDALSNHTNYSTVATFNDEARNHIVFIGGRYMDQVNVKSIDSLTLKKQNGFTLPLSSGEPIIQVINCGISNWGSNSQFLLRSKSTLYHLQSCAVNNHLSSPECSNKLFLSNFQELNMSILEPLEKWHLPNTISDLSSNSTSPYASVVLENGSLGRWNIGNGFQLVVGGSPVFPNLSDGLNSAPFGKRFRVECSLHPMVDYLTIQDKMFLYDFRSQEKASLLLKTKGFLYSLLQRDKKPHQFFISQENKISLFDDRYLKNPFCQKFLPVSHDVMKNSSISIENTNFILGSTVKSDKIFIHTLEDGLNTKNDSFHSFYTAAHPFPTHESLSWDTTSFANPEASSSNGLKTYLYGFAMVSSQNNREEGEKTNCNSLLIQQSSIGDLFVQKLKIGDNPYNIKGNKGLSGFNQFNHDSEVNESLSLVPPVQFCTPCGNRFWGFENHSNEDGLLKSENLGLNQKLGRKRKFRVDSEFLVDNQTSKLDEKAVEKDFFPVGNKTFRKFTPVDVLQGYDLLRLNPENLRRDLPRLSNNKIAAIKKPKPSLKSDVEIKALMLKHEKIIIEFCKSSIKTLWEIWKYMTIELNQIIEIQVLRNYLRNNMKYKENLVSLNNLKLDQKPYKIKQENEINIQNCKKCNKMGNNLTFDGNYILPEKDKKIENNFYHCQCNLNCNCGNNTLNIKKYLHKNDLFCCEYCILPYLLIYNYIDDNDEHLGFIKFSTENALDKDDFKDGSKKSKNKEITTEMINLLTESWELEDN